MARPRVGVPIQGLSTGALRPRPNLTKLANCHPMCHPHIQLIHLFLTDSEIVDFLKGERNIFSALKSNFVKLIPISTEKRTKMTMWQARLKFRAVAEVSISASTRKTLTLFLLSWNVAFWSELVHLRRVVWATIYGDREHAQVAAERLRERRFRVGCALGHVVVAGEIAAARKSNFAPKRG